MVTVTPAYGRDYKSAKAAKADWQQGKDFILQDITSPWDGKPCNIRDLKGQDVILRFSAHTKTTMVKGAPIDER